jgi:hypothetical protein
LWHANTGLSWQSAAPTSARRHLQASGAGQHPAEGAGSERAGGKEVEVSEPRRRHPPLAGTLRGATYAPGGGA